MIGIDKKIEDLSLIIKALGSLSVGIVITDRDGIIKFSNVPDGIDSAKYKYNYSVIGKNIKDVAPKCELIKVMETKKPIFSKIYKTRKYQLVVDFLPIMEKEKVIGSVGIILFRKISEIKELWERINNLEKKLNYALKDENPWRSKYSFDDIIGRSEETKRLKELSKEVAKTDLPVLIEGESGTGKELFAHSIHSASGRGPFVAINCSSIPKDLFEAELFGYEGGSFTGALKFGRPGKVELANGGTLFLDEIGDMPYEAQSKLLRVLQEKEVLRIGSQKPRYSNFRLISSTNRNIESLLKRGLFRLDLFYRINVIRIKIPPLRERRDDILPIFEHYLFKFAKDFGKAVPRLSYDAKMTLLNYSFPGNVRELKNLAHVIVSLKDGDLITSRDLQREIPSIGTFCPAIDDSTIGDSNLKGAISSYEASMLLDTIKRFGGNKTKAARFLGIHRTSLYKKMKKLNIDPKKL